MLPKQKEFLKAEAAKRVSTVCGSAHTGEGMRDVVRALETALASRMEPVNVLIPHEALACTSAGDFGVESGGTLLNTIHRLGSLSAVSVTEQGTQIVGRLPLFLTKQLDLLLAAVRDDRCELVDDDTEEDEEGGGRANRGELYMSDEDFDWSLLAKGRHSVRRKMASGN